VILGRPATRFATQDYLFVRELVRFAALLLSKAPPEHFEVLLGGLAALKDELNWFQVGCPKRCCGTKPFVIFNPAKWRQCESLGRDLHSGAAWRQGGRS
jgi:hypothetical protein